MGMSLVLLKLAAHRSKKDGLRFSHSERVVAQSKSVPHQNNRPNGLTSTSSCFVARIVDMIVCGMTQCCRILDFLEELTSLMVWSLVLSFLDLMSTSTQVCPGPTVT